jgi:hypothetical protein
LLKIEQQDTKKKFCPNNVGFLKKGKTLKGLKCKKWQLIYGKIYQKWNFQ